MCSPALRSDHQEPDRRSCLSSCPSVMTRASWPPLPGQQGQLLRLSMRARAPISPSVAPDPRAGWICPSCTARSTRSRADLWLAGGVRQRRSRQDCAAVEHLRASGVQVQIVQARIEAMFENFRK
jgi:hypothetical protein